MSDASRGILRQPTHRFRGALYCPDCSSMIHPPRLRNSQTDPSWVGAYPCSNFGERSEITLFNPPLWFLLEGPRSAGNKMAQSWAVQPFGLVGFRVLWISHKFGFLPKQPSGDTRFSGFLTILASFQTKQKPAEKKTTRPESLVQKGTPSDQARGTAAGMVRPCEPKTSA